MSRGRREPPIVIGHLKDGVADKYMVAYREESHVRVVIGRLKNEARKHSGDEITLEDIQSIISDTLFCRKESLRVYINGLQGILDEWEKEESK